MRFTTETIVGLFVLTSLSVFLYLSYYLGIFNFDKSYVKYNAYFQDISGLTKKADIKISGVKVGWIESFKLKKDYSVKIEIMVHKKYPISIDSKATIKQDGFLGAKYIDLIPGKSETNLEPNGKLKLDNCIPVVSLEDVMLSIKNLSESLSKIVSREDFNELKEKTIKLSNNLEEAFNSSKANFDSNLNRLADAAKSTCENINDIICSTGSAVRPALNFINRARNTKALIDSHIELAPKLTKFYFNTQLYPSDNYFFTLGVRLADSRKFDYKKIYNRWGLNLQLGAIYDPFAIRLGIFEGYLGVSGECLIPMPKNFKFLTTIQAFDFFRTHKHKPYLRWLNEIYVSPNFYIACGIDNLINHKYRTGFIGAGVRFST